MAAINEVVVIDAIRTPTGKAGWGGKKQGQLSPISAQSVGALILDELVGRVQKKAPQFNPHEIEDIAFGCLSQIGDQGMNLARMATLASQLPYDAAGWTLNRYCNAGLQAINSMAQAIMVGAGDIMIAAGIEMMSRYGMGSDFEVVTAANWPVELDSRASERGGFSIMGVCAEIVADMYELHKEEMDRFGLWSHQKALKAMEDEKAYKKRVIPINVAGSGKSPIYAKKDESPRPKCLLDPDAAYADIKNLPPRFRENGKVTAGNSSGIVDGGAGVMLMSASKAKNLGLKPMVRVRSMAVAGSDPNVMLLGPIPAMKKALSRANLTMDDIGVFEPNEAFASPVLAFCKEFGLAFDDPRINPTGGAIAIGHPIGCSGVLYFTEMLHWMVNNNVKYGLQTLCGGGGIGIATIVELV